MGGGAPVSDNVIHRLAMNDPTPWWRKPNLRSLYLLLFPCVIGIEMTSGFDSQIINAVQIVPAWKDCRWFFFLCFYASYSSNLEPVAHAQVLTSLIRSLDFGHPSGGYQGILASSLPLGSCIGLPFIPFINDNYGRRWCIMFGSILMIIGSLLQAFAVNGSYPQIASCRGIKWASPFFGFSSRPHY